MPEIPTKVMHLGKLENGKMVPIRSVQEHIQTYTLEDGTVVNLRCVLTQVVRLEDKVNQNGDPIYVMQSQIVASTVIPPNMKKSQ